MLEMILKAKKHTRRARLFRNGRNQAVRIPREFEFSGDEVVLRREGRQLIIEPLRPNDLWIAAHALALDFTLVTDNVAGFSRVPGLRVENSAET